MKDIPVLLGTLVLTASAGVAGENSPPIFGDWWYIMPDGWQSVEASAGWDPCVHVPRLNYDNPATYLPVNQSGGGHGGPVYGDGVWMSWYAQCMANQLNRVGAPIALMIRNRNCPFPYAAGNQVTTPDALPQALEALPKLDYVLMDLEEWGQQGSAWMQANAAEITRLVRTHSNPRSSDAFIGNYSDWPGVRDEAMIWPGKRDRTNYRSGQDDRWDRDRFYHDHFNVAMPNAYPYEVYSRHSEERLQRGNHTPNDRAAIFWAPIERVSAAARNLPRGHKLIPWISNYVDFNGHEEYYHAPAPSWEDLEAMVQHYRLRGSTSYYIWTPNQGATHHPTLDHDSFSELAIEAWRMLDPLFEDAGRVEFLNLETDKQSGLQWSAARAGSTVWVLVSNLHHELEQSAALPLIEGLPTTTPAVAPGEHLLLSYEVDPAVRDFNGDGEINPSDFISFITSVQNARAVDLAANTVGGLGTDPLDVDGSGLVDLIDVVAVSDAFTAGKYADPDTGGGVFSKQSGQRTAGRSSSRRSRH